MFVRLKNGEEFHQSRLVRLAGRAISVWLNPFRVLLAKRVVNLMLKLNVRADFAGAARRRVHIHTAKILAIRPLAAKARLADFEVILKR